MIKNCTSIEQSRKLLELGIDVDTADMCWCIRKLQWGEINKTIIAYPMLPNQEKSEDFKYIPAWSLTALLDLLPNNEHITTTLSRGGWKIEPQEYIDKWFCEYENEVDEDSPYRGFTVSADNPVDAVYNMIIKLHERNLL